MADFTVASKIEAPKLDALGIASNVTALRQGMLNNKLLDQQVKSKIALGAAITSAYDPATGKVDWDKAGANLAQDKDGSFAMPQFAADQQARQLADMNLSKEQVATSLAKLKPASDLALSLIAGAKQTPLTRDNIISAIKTNLLDPGILNLQHPQDQQMLTGIASQLTDDPAKNQIVLSRLYAQLHPTVEGLNTLFGAPEKTDTGPNVAITRTSPATGQTELTGVIDKGLSPGEVNTPAYTYTDKDGVQHIVTKGEAAAAKPGETPAGVTSGLPIGSAEAAGAAVQQATALQSRAAIVPTRKAALSNIVNTLDTFTPGPKADLTYMIGALATQAGVKAPAVTKGVAGQEEFNKLAAQIALDQWGSLGGTGSNEQLATAMKANPNAAMSKMGIKNVVALLQGNEDAISAQFDAWKKYSAAHGPASYGDFLAGWNRYYDPRVFQAEHMKPDDVKSMLAKMTPDERKTFVRDKSIAEQAGWLGR